LGKGVVLDPAIEMSAGALLFAVEEGYGDHAVSAPLLGRRTVWALSRALRLGEREGLRLVPLVQTSAEAWEELDLEMVFRTPERLAGRAGSTPRGERVLAAAAESKASGMRLVVLGSKAIARNDHAVYYNRDLLELAVAWLAGDAVDLGIAAHRPEELKLSLGQDELRRVFWVCVVGLPLLVLLVGGGVYWRRRA